MRPPSIRRAPPRRFRHVVTLGALALCGGSVACGSEGTDQLTAAEREEVAQRYADSVRAISASTDSACARAREARVARLADSIYEVRLADIERERSRSPL